MEIDRSVNRVFGSGRYGADRVHADPNAECHQLGTRLDGRPNDYLASDHKRPDFNCDDRPNDRPANHVCRLSHADSHSHPPKPNTLGHICHTDHFTKPSRD